MGDGGVADGPTHWHRLNQYTSTGPTWRRVVPEPTRRAELAGVASLCGAVHLKLLYIHYCCGVAEAGKLLMKDVGPLTDITSDHLLHKVTFCPNSFAWHWKPDVNLWFYILCHLLLSVIDIIFTGTHTLPHNIVNCHHLSGITKSICCVKHTPGASTAVTKCFQVIPVSSQTCLW